ncbi:conserved domain protein [Parvimonas sp. oral taxon 393 str. F0440]|nr:conserved domain protein [Parvimonas sp. oral taxon 393 str. F0440]
MVNNKKEKEQFEKEEKQMNFNLFNARESAEKVVIKLKDTPRKIDAYRNKLISCLTFKDYEKFSVTLLQLSSYSSVTFDFAYYLFKDFEKIKMWHIHL